MTVRRILKKQGRHPCHWCDAPATERGFGWGRCACAEHHGELLAWDGKAQEPDYSDAQFVGDF